MPWSKMGRSLVYLTGSMLPIFLSGMDISASLGFTDMDVEWMSLLQERLGAHGEGYEDAKAFWKDMCNLRRYLDLDEKGQETLKRLS